MTTSPEAALAKLSLKNICYRFSAKHHWLFYELTLQVMANQVVGIVGTSGVGKSTLFNLASGLLAPQSGGVWIDGVEVTAKTGQVGYMLQKDLLLPFKSVYENIALPLILKNTPKEEIRAIIEPKLPLFGLQGLAHQFPHQLSGGQRQRAALLRTYLSNHKLMLLDEPFSALDFVTKVEMYDWFAQFRAQTGVTCLIITHDIDEAICLSDVVYVLKGTPASLTKGFDIEKSAHFLQSDGYLKLKQEILMNIK